MTEHWFMVTMLFLVGLETAVSVYFGYRIFRKSEQFEGVTAAIYLEARKILSEVRH